MVRSILVCIDGRDIPSFRPRKAPLPPPKRMMPKHLPLGHNKYRTMELEGSIHKVHKVQNPLKEAAKKSLFRVYRHPKFPTCSSLISS